MRFASVVAGTKETGQLTSDKRRNPLQLARGMSVLLKRKSTKPQPVAMGTRLASGSWRDQIPARRRTVALTDWRILPISAHGSELSLARRFGTVSTVNASGRTPFSTSSQNSGVDTGAPERARGEAATP